MTIKKEFICNFCRNYNYDKVIFGVHWGCKELKITDKPDNSENHLCLTCINAIKLLKIKE